MQRRKKESLDWTHQGTENRSRQGEESSLRLPCECENPGYSSKKQRLFTVAIRWSVVDLPFKLAKKRHVVVHNISRVHNTSLWFHMHLAYVNRYGMVWANTTQYLWNNFLQGWTSMYKRFSHGPKVVFDLDPMVLDVTLDGFPLRFSHFHPFSMGISMAWPSSTSSTRFRAPPLALSSRLVAQLQGFSGLWESASRLDLRF